jgi:phage terminase Nu1 subunit (DNA packaging protein)
MAQTLSTTELRQLTGRSRQAINKAEREGRLHRDPHTQRFDPSHTTNRLFIERSQIESGAQDPDDEPADPDEAPDDMSELYRQKVEREIARIDEQIRKLQISNAREARDLVDLEVVTRVAGRFAASLRTNILTIPSRIARGNKELEQEIEDDVSNAIERALEMAYREIDAFIDDTYGTEISEAIQNYERTASEAVSAHADAAE